MRGSGGQSPGQPCGGVPGSRPFGPAPLAGVRGGDLMANGTTARRSDHKATTNQRAGTVQKASEQNETAPGQGERGKAGIEQARSGDALIMGIKLPGGTRDNLLWWGGLAALAALGVVDWPVAAVAAVGTWIAEQHVQHEQHVQQQRQLVGAEADVLA